jgi:xylose isomerase
MDCCARGLKAATRMIEDKALSGPLEDRYAGWKTAEGKAMLSGKRSLEEIAERVVKKKIEPQPKSGRQEYLENIVNRYV